ncbi:MAG: AAA family ATPase [Actinomycetota bacterium]|nr:AAA family ATPase [Actinomycetota bacterium]
MDGSESGTGQRSLNEYLAVLRRRRWVALVPVLLIPIVAFVQAYQQPKVYGSTAEVLLSRDDLGSVLAGTTNADIYTDADRFAQTQASLARVSEVAERAIARANATMRPAQLLASSSVTPRGNADLLTFTVKSSDPVLSGRLATAYAEAFSQYRLELDTANLANARTDLLRNLGELRKQGATDSPLYRQLAQKAQELRTLELLKTKPRVVNEAGDGVQVAPTPRRSAMLGLGVGLLLGLAAAFLWEALDRRVRDESEIQRMLGLPLLARLPAPRQVAGQDRLAMLDGPSEGEAEAVRRLRSNVELANLDVNAKVIMVTSSVSGEGKSVTVANLAVALARSGRRVVLVDLDLRKPAVGRLMGVGYRAGLTDVAIDRVSLERALVPVRLDAAEPIKLASRARDRSAEEPASVGPDAAGQLWILPAGFLPANPGELVGTRAVANILDELRKEADFVLVDAPPLLAVSDALTLSTRVDALLVVVRLGIVDRPMLRELARQLDVSPARKLGFVLAGGTVPEAYGYYGAQPSDESRRSPRVAPREERLEDAVGARVEPRESPSQSA